MQHEFFYKFLHKLPSNSNKMAGKNQLLRMIVLDGMLRRDTPVQMHQMVSACMSNPAMLRVDSDIKISERTIREDLKFMRNQFGAPIPLRNLTGYQYEDLSYSIFQVPLMRTELEVLQQVGNFLNQFEGFDLGKELQQIVSIGQSLSDMQAELAQPTIDLGLPGNQLGNQWLKIFYNALSTREAVRVDYRSFSGAAETSEVFKPYLLKLYNRRWYVLGKSNLRPELITNYALNRIQGASPIQGNRYEIPQDFKQEHFSYIMGTTLYLDHPILDIELEIKKPYAFYMKQTPWHQTQLLIAETPDAMRFQLRLRENRELINNLLSLGSNLVSILPESLAHKLLEELQSMQNQLRH
jgi:predicted DNA-binding transcriptional regulator YafY